MIYDDGNRFEGNWQNGKPHGQGVMINANGQQLQGYFKQGKLMQNMMLTFNESKFRKFGCNIDL